MEAKAKVAAAAAIVVLGAACWVAVDQFGADRRDTVGTPAELPADEQSAASGKRVGPENAAPIVGKPYSEAGGQAAAAELPGAASQSTSGGGATTAAAGRRLRGRVIDTHSVPTASVRVVFKPDESKDGAPETMPEARSPSAVSDADGVFEMEAPLRSGTIEAQSAQHATVLWGTFDPRATSVEPVIIVAPIIKIAGQVIDENRRPIVGARIMLELPQDFRANFSQILDYSMRRGIEVKTDREGAFSIDSAPDVPGTAVRTHLEGYEVRTDPLPGGAATGLEIVLRKTRAMPDTLAGTVVDHAGVGVPAARVSSRDHTTRTDDAGRFTIKIDGNAHEGWLMALKDGFLPARLAFDPAKPPDAAIVLRLEGAPLSISGRVVDGDGKPLRGIRVWTADPTLFASTREHGIQFVENLLSGPTARNFWVTVESDDDGRFVLRGLMPRDYRIHAMDPKTLALEEAGPVKAGSTGVVITLPGGDVHSTVAGVVVSLTGAPVAKVTVKPQRDTFSFSVDRGGTSTSHADTEAVVTGEDGRFSLRNIPTKGVYLRIDGADILPREFGRDGGLEAAAEGQDLGRLRIGVSVRCHVQVELGSDAELADQISILDPKDHEVPIDVFEGRGRLTRYRVPIEGGRTSVLAVPQDSKSVVFLKKGKEVTRKTIRLTPGTVTKVRP
jgi:protocatechuate 3,4-dioxygenase beta subunit